MRVDHHRTDRSVGVAITRFIKRGGKLWIRIFPDSVHPEAGRNGMARQRRAGEVGGGGEPGRIMFEMAGVDEARQGSPWGWRRTAAIPTKFRFPRGGFNDAAANEKIREAGVDELLAQDKELTEMIFRLRFQLSTGQAEALKRLREAKKDLARVKTLVRAHELKAEGVMTN